MNNFFFQFHEHIFRSSLKKTLFFLNFMTPFYGWGSTASQLVPRYSWYSFYQPWKDERLSQLWNYRVVLNMGHLDWKSSTLTTRPLLHKEHQLQPWELGKKYDGNFIFTFDILEVRYDSITTAKIFQHGNCQKQLLLLCFLLLSCFYTCLFVFTCVLRVITL